jgi:hypothetical protein
LHPTRQGKTAVTEKDPRALLSRVEIANRESPLCRLSSFA